MFTDSQSTLQIILAISAAFLTIFLSVALIYVILILRDVNKMLDRVRETVEAVNTFVLKPVSLATSIVDHLRPVIESLMERHNARKERAESKKGRGHKGE